MPQVATKSQLSARKNQILVTAAKLFRDRGYAGTSMRDISRAVGIEAASLYSHIKSKEEILSHICFDLMSRFYNKSENEVPGMRDALAGLLKGHISVLIENPEAAVVFENDWKFLPEEEQIQFKSQRINYEWKFNEAIRAGIRFGHLREINPRYGVQLLFSATRWIPENYRPNSTTPPAEFAREITELILGGFRR